MTLDKLLLGKINKRKQTYKFFKTARITKEGLQLLEQQHINFIKAECETYDLDPKDYLDHYNK